jgi:hypothetical protein
VGLTEINPSGAHLAFIVMASTTTKNVLLNRRQVEWPTKSSSAAFKGYVYVIFDNELQVLSRP